jgi:hypothetical protein
MQSGAILGGLEGVEAAFASRLTCGSYSFEKEEEQATDGRR